MKKRNIRIRVVIAGREAFSMTLRDYLKRMRHDYSGHHEAAELVFDVPCNNDWSIALKPAGAK